MDYLRSVQKQHNNRRRKPPFHWRKHAQSIRPRSTVDSHSTIATTSDTDDTIQLNQQNCPKGNEASTSAATELVIDEEAVLFRPRLSFVSED